MDRVKVSQRPRIYATEDAKQLAKRRLPRMIFDFIEGSAGREAGAAHNESRFNDIKLQPRAMAEVSNRSLTTKFLGCDYGMPIGIAPMGMCNLACSGSDEFIARLAIDRNMPVCLSSAGSSSLEEMREWSGDLAWFQLYFRESAEVTFQAVERARVAGYDTLILTVDVPEVSRRIRDQQNGFNLPFRITPRAFLDFALHPRWSISTLLRGVPKPRNFATEGESFDRNASRAGANWSFLQGLREIWAGKLIVKGITSPEDAVRVQSLGVDAIYVSNHGGRQLDSAPPAIDILPIIRDVVGPDYPLLFDSGIRNGEDVVKALALGADFVMLGRPILYALAAAGGEGLQALIQCFADDIDLAMAQIGVSRIEDIDAQTLFSSHSPSPHLELTARTVPLSAAT
ncbi:MAG: alpha-hydroxy acid oxidase [Boseongicola sp.]